MKATVTYLLTTLSFVVAVNAQPQFGHRLERQQQPVYELPYASFTTGMPTAIWDGSQYAVFHSGPEQGGADIHRAVSDNLTSGWAPAPETPILTRGGSWQHYMGAASVVANADGSLEMWYSAETAAGAGRIGYATSPDGLTWTVNHANGITLPRDGTWDATIIGYPHVIKENGSYRMWYTGFNSSYREAGIGYATSNDGVNWTPHSGNPVLTDGNWAMKPVILQEGGMYYMWYADWAGSGIRVQIHFAMSSDGIDWTPDPNGPVLEVGFWDWEMVSPMGVFKQDDGSYTLLYFGVGSGVGGIGVATLASTSTSVESEAPRSFSLSQNYPNPFNPTTSIDFELETSSKVRLTVLDMLGREVAVITDGLKPAGAHSVNFDATGLKSGAYMYRLAVGAHVQTRTMHLLK